MNSRYEILSGLPAYGPMPVPVTDNERSFFSEGFVFRFYKKDGTSWVANFAPGWTTFNSVYDFPDINKTIIFAGGICYIMTPEESKPLQSFGLLYQAAIQTDDRRLIAVDNTAVTIIDPCDEVWISERISWDGISDVVLEGETLSGLSYDPGTDKQMKFSLNIRTMEIIGGSYRNSE